MLPLLKQLAALTLLIIPKSKREDKNQDSELVYLTTHMTQTPELAILAARQEVQRVANFALKQTDKLLYAIKTDDEKLFERLLTDATEYETNTDVLEYKINTYLTQLTHGNLSRHAVAQTLVLFELTGSLESMTDCGEKIAKVLKKYRFTKASDFTVQDLENLETMAHQTREMAKHCAESLRYFPNIAPQEKQIAGQLLDTVYQEEEKLNALRTELREAHNTRLSEGTRTTAQAITAYSDVLNNFERMGDYALRITEAVLKRKSTQTSPLHSTPAAASARGNI